MQGLCFNYVACLLEVNQLGYGILQVMGSLCYGIKQVHFLVHSLHSRWFSSTVAFLVIPFNSYRSKMLQILHSPAILLKNPFRIEQEERPGRKLLVVPLMR